MQVNSIDHNVDNDIVHDLLRERDRERTGSGRAYFITSIMAKKMKHAKELLQSKNMSREPRLVVIMLCSILAACTSLPKHAAVQAQVDSASPVGKLSDQGQRLVEVFVSKGAEMNHAKNSEERLLNRMKRKRGAHHRGANKRKQQSGVAKRKKKTARKKRRGRIYDTGGKPMAPSGWWQAQPAWGSNTGSWQATPSSNADSIGLGTCGGGSIGNNKCPNNSECCSEYGFCGTSAEFCTNMVGNLSSNDDSISVEDSGPTWMTFSKSGKASKNGKMGKMSKSSGSLQAPPVLGSIEGPQLGGTEAPPVFERSIAPPVLGSTEAPPVLGGTDTPPVLGSSSEAPPVWGSSSEAPTVWGSSSDAPPVWGSSSEAPPVWGSGTHTPPAWGGGWVYPSPPHTPHHVKCGEWGSASSYRGGWYDPCIATNAPTCKCDVVVRNFPVFCFFHPI
jgi:hypothetical protein